jgi:hypothetical protein
MVGSGVPVQQAGNLVGRHGCFVEGWRCREGRGGA